MDEKENIIDDIEIIDDIVDEEILFLDDEVEHKTTYAEDTSLKDNENISLGNEEEGHSLDDALTKFSTDENTISFEMPKEEAPKVTEEPIFKKEMSFESEGPSLSDEMDSTMVLAKQAISPTKEVLDDSSDDSKSNKRAIIFIIFIFVLLAAIVIALPYIKNLF